MQYEFDLLFQLITRTAGQAKPEPLAYGKQLAFLSERYQEARQLYRFHFQRTPEGYTYQSQEVFRFLALEQLTPLSSDAQSDDLRLRNELQQKAWQQHPFPIGSLLHAELFLGDAEVILQLTLPLELPSLPMEEVRDAYYQEILLREEHRIRQCWQQQAYQQPNEEALRHYIRLQQESLHSLLMQLANLHPASAGNLLPLLFSTAQHLYQFLETDFPSFLHPDSLLRQGYVLETSHLELAQAVEAALRENTLPAELSVLAIPHFFDWK